MGKLFDRSVFPLGLAAALSAPLQACHGGATSVPATPNFSESQNRIKFAGSCSVDEVVVNGSRIPRRAVDALSTTSAVAVGGQANKTDIDQYNGTSWTGVTSPDPGTVIDILNAVGGSSSTNVWAVGTEANSTASGFERTLIVHFNAVKWTAFPSPNKPTKVGGSIGDNVLLGVAAHSSSDAMAVGSYTGQDGNAHLLTEHWNGAKWSLVSIPDPGGSSALTGIARAGATDYIAVGHFGSSPTTNKPFSELWNGTLWKLLPHPTFPANTSLNAVSGLAANDAFAVGNSGATAPSGVAWHWNETSWVDIKYPAGLGQEPVGVAEISPTSVIVAVNNFANSKNTATIEWFHNSSWVDIQVGNPGMTDSFNGAAAIPGTTDAWAVGGFTNATGTSPLIEKINCGP